MSEDVRSCPISVSPKPSYTTSCLNTNRSPRDKAYLTTQLTMMVYWIDSKFINKGEEYQVYGKPIPSTLVTNDIQNSEAYKTFIGISTGLIPLKKGRGKGAQGTKAIVVLKKTNATSKKKQSKRKLALHDESDESEGEPENRPIGRKKRSPRAVVIQEPPSIPVKKTQESSGKL
ncbi:hypothetical protein Tco_0253336, partial [Tanacetum coccineum]